jgi:hypothetical protein
MNQLCTSAFGQGLRVVGDFVMESRKCGDLRSEFSSTHGLADIGQRFSSASASLHFSSVLLVNDLFSMSEGELVFNRVLSCISA